MRNYILILTFINLFAVKLTFANDFNIFSSIEEEELNQISDPYEKINRKIYAFNVFVDNYTTKPAAKFYQITTSEEIRANVTNFYKNITMPITIANSLLQGDFKNLYRAARSFLINSTVGIFGLFAPAEQNFKFKKSNREDFGQTLAKYNVGSGPYLMLPFFGPSSTRHLTGKIIDMPLSPNWYINEESFRSLYTTSNIINQREKLLGHFDDIQKNTLDPYSVIKSSYYQRRNKMISNEIN